MHAPQGRPSRVVIAPALALQQPLAPRRRPLTVMMYRSVLASASSMRRARPVGSTDSASTMSVSLLRRLSKYSLSLMRS